MLVPLLADTDLRSRFLVDSVDHNLGITRFVTADVSMSNSITAFQEALDLTTVLASASKFVFEACLYLVSGAVEDIQIRFSFRFANINALVAWGDQTTVAATPGSATHVTRTIATTGALQAIQPSGWIATGTAPLPLSVLFAQDTAGAGLTYLKSGSWMHVVKVA